MEVEIGYHVKYKSKVCRPNLLLRGPIIDSEQAFLVDEEGHPVDAVELTPHKLF